MSAMATFSIAVSSGMRSPCWKTKPKLSRRSLDRPVSPSAVTSTGTPDAGANVTRPWSGAMIPASTCRSVVLPEPEAPMTATDSPRRMLRSTPASAVVDP